MIRRHLTRKSGFAACLAACCASLTAAAPLAAQGTSWEAKSSPWAEIENYPAARPFAQHSETALWVTNLRDGAALLFREARDRPSTPEMGTESGMACAGGMVAVTQDNPGLWIGLDRRYTLYRNHFARVSVSLDLPEQDCVAPHRP